MALEVNPILKLYEKGIYETTAPCGFFKHHAMIAYGYDVSDKENSYFLLRNSWGDFWGDWGNMKWKIVSLKDNNG